jgi:hypothetical protein
MKPPKKMSSRKKVTLSRDRITQPKVMGAAEDEARAVLEGWEYAAKEELATLTWRNDNGTPKMPEERRDWQTYLAEQRLKHIPLATDAAARGDAWAAALHALWLGLMSGFDQAHPDAYHARRQLRLQEPFTIIGRKQRADSAAGTAELQRRKRLRIIEEGTLDRAILQSEIDAKKTTKRHLKDTRIRELVAAAHKISERTLRRRLKK